MNTMLYGQGVARAGRWLLVALCCGAALTRPALAAEGAPDEPALSAVPAVPAAAPATDGERLQVTEPFLELHTGPGRGYPVHQVVQRHDWVVIELRRTDWYRVRTERGVVGWADREQLASTLTAAGVHKTFRDILVDDYLRRRVQMGTAWGHFEGAPQIKLWAGVKVAETLSLESAVEQVQGKFESLDGWHADLVSEPWSDQRWSPFASVGMGRFKRQPNASLVNVTTQRAKQSHAALGINVHVSDRFIARADWGLHTVYYTDTLTTEYRAWSLGVAFFF